MAFKPTDEQQTIRDAFPTGDNLVIEAGAGSGKTSTLKMLAADSPNRRGLYLAFNRTVKDDAIKSFPGSVTCQTYHGMAYGPVGYRFRRRLDKKARVTAVRAAQILGINQPFKLDADLMLQPKSIARLATETVSRFCQSADAEVSHGHVPAVPGIDVPAARRALAEVVLPYARRAWADLINPDGNLYFSGDVYLKLFQLSGPVLPFDYLLVDEAQDLDPVVKAIVDAQQMQVCLVGDRCQAIYGWRGAVDAMENAGGKRLYLSQSFRFGPAIAEEANKWLSVLNADMRLRGFDQIKSTVAPLETPDAVLCRGNAAALKRVMSAVDKGVRVGLVGKTGNEIKAMAWAAADLMNGRSTDHPELMAFSNWAEVQDYCENESSGADLKLLVSMVDRYGTDKLISTMNSLTDERYAKLVVSTAHKAKGREWGGVQICDDFREPKASEDNPNPRIDRAEAMLAYVAVTRAKQVLDRDGLAWVDNWVPGGTPAAAVEPVRPAPTSLEVSTVDAPPVAAVAGPVTAAASEPVVAIVEPETAPQPSTAPFAVGSTVRYRPGKYRNLTLFKVAAARVCGDGWRYDLSQPDGRLQRGIQGAWLEAAEPAQPVVADATPEPAPVQSAPEPCLRCRRINCWCGPDELRRFLAIRAARTAEEGRAAIEAYQRATGTWNYSAGVGGRR